MRVYIYKITFFFVLAFSKVYFEPVCHSLVDKLAVLANIQIHILVNLHSLELLGVLADLKELLHLLGAVVRLQVTLVLGHDHWLGLLTTETVAERSLNDNLGEDGAVVELNGEAVADGAESGVMVVGGELGVLNALDLLAKRLDQRGSGSLAAVNVVVGSKTAEDEHDGAHVLDAVVTIGEVVHGLELLVDDADAGLVCPAGDLLDIGGRLAHGLQLGVDLLRGLDSGLRVELGRVGHLEQDVLHDVAAIGALELELLALEEDIIEAPDGRGENGGNTALALENLQGQVDGALAGITGSPRLAGHGVGGVAVGTQALAVNPRLGDGIGSLLLVEAEHLADNSRAGNLDENYVIQTNLVERVEQSKAALNLVRLDHSLENIADGEDLAASEVTAGLVGTGDPVSHGQDSAQVVTGMSPLSSEPAVVVVEPSDHSTNVEGTVHGVELIGCAGNLGAVGHDGPWDDRAEELGALLELETLQTAAESVEEHPSRCVELFKGERSASAKDGIKRG